MSSWDGDARVLRWFSSTRRTIAAWIDPLGPDDPTLGVNHQVARDTTIGRLIHRADSAIGRPDVDTAKTGSAICQRLVVLPHRLHSRPFQPPGVIVVAFTPSVVARRSRRPHPEGYIATEVAMRCVGQSPRPRCRKRCAAFGRNRARQALAHAALTIAGRASWSVPARVRGR